MNRLTAAKVRSLDQPRQIFRRRGPVPEHRQAWFKELGSAHIY